MTLWGDYFATKRMQEFIPRRPGAGWLRHCICRLSKNNAVWAWNPYTLRYLRDPQLQRNVHRSQNRLESYHQLRSAIAQVGGKKELTGRTDIEIEISNQCGRLIANIIIYFNSAILSRLLTRQGPCQTEAFLALIAKISPAAWRHLLLNGHYTFRSNGQFIDLDAIVAGLNLG